MTLQEERDYLMWALCMATDQDSAHIWECMTAGGRKRKPPVNRLNGASLQRAMKAEDERSALGWSLSRFIFDALEERDTLKGTIAGLEAELLECKREN